jgi:TolB protein
MRHVFHFNLALAAILLCVIHTNICLGETAEPKEPAGQSIVGPWHADSVALSPGNGAKRTLPNNEQKPLNIAISDNTMTMRVGDQKFAEMEYSMDAKLTPATIDMKFQGQDMLGIYELKGDNLKISLNDSKKNRPKDFGANDNDMDLVLHCFKGRQLMIIGADGTNPRPLTDLQEYTFGSSDWSPDGGKISADCWRSFVGNDYAKSHIYVFKSDGSSPKDLGDGTLSSWSPDGKRISYSRYSPNNGIWVMNADGTENQLLASDGWSSDWSPKTDELAYTVGSNICVHDLKTNKRRNLIDKIYNGIYWGLAWSPDGQWICFQGTLPDGGSELALVSAKGQAKGFKVLLPSKNISDIKGFQTCFSWSPDSKNITLSMTLEGDRNTQIYILDAEGNKPPQRLAAQNPKKQNYTPAWSPDGKSIIFALQN